MTVAYQFDLCTANFGKFMRLLMHWRGSIYKLVFKEFLCFSLFYYIIALIYHFAMNEAQAEQFQSIGIWIRDFLKTIPMNWMLGFYVTMILGRWWEIFNVLPWPDRTMLLINTYVEGDSEKARIYRRTLIRYLNISAVLCLRSVSTAVRMRFPSLQHMVDADILTPEEKDMLESINPEYGDYYQPIYWFSTLALEARNEGYIKDELRLREIIKEASDYRSCMAGLLAYDWVPVPLVYTQVVTLAVYIHFFFSLFGNQYVDDKDQKYKFTRFFPLFTFLNFFFYVGWLKVAEVMINPLGDDDDDFEVNFIVDRNIGLGFICVDDMYKKHPALGRDPFWSNPDPHLPYTESTLNTCIKPYLGSATKVEVKETEHEWVETDWDEATERNERGGLNRLSGTVRRYMSTRRPSARSLTMSTKKSKQSMHHHPSWRRQDEKFIQGNESGIANGQQKPKLEVEMELENSRKTRIEEENNALSIRLASDKRHSEDIVGDEFRDCFESLDSGKKAGERDALRLSRIAESSSSKDCEKSEIRLKWLD